MSEMISMDEQIVERAGVVELGSASEKTRGSSAFFVLLDGIVAWPYIYRSP